MTSEKIVSFLKSHPLIKINGLEEQAECPQGTILKAINGNRAIREHHIDKIAAVLKNYGLKY